MESISFQPDDLLWQQGGASDHALLIESGTVEVIEGYPTVFRVVGTFGPGEVVGEMALIDERPRPHTVCARDAGKAKRLGRDEFIHSLMTVPKLVRPFLEALFERLRRLETRLPTAPADREGRRQGGLRLRLCPLTRFSAKLLPAEGLVIETFPFRIGRASEAFEGEPGSLNDFWLMDEEPFRISRNHMSIDLLDGTRYVIRDRGSSLGTIVNESHIGGRSEVLEATLEEGDNVVILGPRSSPFQFRAVLEPAVV